MLAQLPPAMSSTLASPLSITNAAQEPLNHKDAVKPQKTLKTKGAVRCRASFSIDEILKPSFGVKTCTELDNSRPVDMRTERHISFNATSKNEKLHVDLNVGLCPARSSSPGEHSDSSRNSSSRDSSPASRDRSSSADSTRCEYDKFYDEYKSRFRDAQVVFPQYKESMLTFENLHYLTTRSYYDTLNHVFGFNNPIGSHLYHHLGPGRQFMNPHSGSPNLSSNNTCASVYANINTSLKILTANNNTNYVQKSTLSTAIHGTNFSIRSKPTQASHKASLATKPNSNICTGSDRKSGQPAAGAEDRKTTLVRTDEKFTSGDTQDGGSDHNPKDKFVWPAWVYCTRYSDRPSSGPRYRKPRTRSNNENDKRPRTAFSTQQLHRLRHEFETCPYLSETRRQSLALELGLNESQVKIWFQNKRAKLKKSTGSKNQLALRLMEEGLYNHSTIVVDVDDNNKCDDRHSGNGSS